MLKALLVDDHALIRIALKQLLAEGFPQAQIGEASDARTAMKEIVKTPWDIVLLDINMRTRSGVELLRDIKCVRPELPVLMVTGCGEDEFAVRSLKAGASGFLSKERSPEELIPAVKKILGGGKYITPTLAEKLADEISRPSSAPHQSLSDREFEVLRMIGKGLAVSEIGESLGLSVKTVSTYRARILEKMEMKNNAALARYAIKNNLVE